MGLDLVLGAMVLLAAVRGWFKGFTSQAVRLGSFVACFYLASPVREEIRPYIAPKLSAMDPALLDRILWWVSVVIAYILMLAFLSLSIRLMATPPEPGEPKIRKPDRFGGLLLGAAKGLLVAAFLGAAVLKFGADLGKHFPWVERQTQGSFALKWTERYQPVPRIWATPPVRRFVEHIQRNGLGQSAEDEPAKEVAGRTSVDSDPSSLPPRLDLPLAEAPAD